MLCWGVCHDLLPQRSDHTVRYSITPSGQGRADREHNPELFWALRGGGGNFGVVTSFTFRTHDIGENGIIIGGPVLYDLADAAEVMRWYRDLVPSLPEQLSGWIALLTIPPAPPFPEELWGRKACGIVWCYTGPHAQADKVLEPIRSFGKPLVVGLMEMPFSALQGAFDPLYPAGLQWYWRADFIAEIPDDAVALHAEFAKKLEKPVKILSAIFLVQGSADERLRSGPGCGREK
jgi:hypothetical protein